MSSAFLSLKTKLVWYIDTNVNKAGLDLVYLGLDTNVNRAGLDLVYLVLDTNVSRAAEFEPSISSPRYQC